MISGKYCLRYWLFENFKEVYNWFDSPKYAINTLIRIFGHNYKSKDIHNFTQDGCLVDNESTLLNTVVNVAFKVLIDSIELVDYEFKLLNIVVDVAFKLLIGKVE